MPMQEITLKELLIKSIELEVRLTALSEKVSKENKDITKYFTRITFTILTLIIIDILSDVILLLR